MSERISAGSSVALPVHAVAADAVESVGVSTVVAKPTRLGQISFVNCLPVTLPLFRGAVPVSAEVSYCAPSVLNRMFKENRLDAGAMSSFYYLSEQSRLTLLPDISIACRGAVGSVLFFSKRKLADLCGARVFGSAQSATSVNLLKVLLKEQLGVSVVLQADDRPELNRSDVDAALVIGDHALEIDNSWSSQYYRIDLGQWWYDSYQLPMVFGVWAASSQWVDEHPGAFSDLSAAHVNARNLGLGSMFPAVLQEAEARTGLSAARLERYYKTELDFGLTEEHLTGLELYRSLCVKHELL